MSVALTAPGLACDDRTELHAGPHHLLLSAFLCLGFVPLVWNVDLKVCFKSVPSHTEIQMGFSDSSCVEAAFPDWGDLRTSSAKWEIFIDERQI